MFTTKRVILRLLLSAAVAVGILLASSPAAQAAVDRPYSLDSWGDSVWGTVHFTSDHSFTADAKLWNETGVAVGFQICWGYIEGGTQYITYTLGCGPIRINGQQYRLRTYTGLNASSSIARIDWAHVKLFRDGVVADSSLQLWN